MQKELLTTEEYYNKFMELYNSGAEIRNETTGEIFEAEADEIFKQCWADTTARKYFPKYWFVSEKENVLSLKDDKIVWLHKNRRKGSNKISYKFVLRKDEETSQTKNIEAHNLVALVFDSNVFGLAKKLIDEKGLEAFGANSSTEPVVQGDHMNGDDTNNSPDNIQLVTDNAHKIVGNAPAHNAPNSAHYKHMQKLAKLAEDENPNGITVALTGDVYDTKTGTWSRTGEHAIFSTDSLKISSDCLKKVPYVACIPLNEKSSDLYTKLMKIPGEEEKLNAYVVDKYKKFGLTAFDMVYKDMELNVTIICDKTLKQWLEAIGILNRQ